MLGVVGLIGWICVSSRTVFPPAPTQLAGDGALCMFLNFPFFSLHLSTCIVCCNHSCFTAPHPHHLHFQRMCRLRRTGTVNGLPP
ncbi:hypothetical protein FPV67DRAFT_1491611 [Lyophyllum atratum]|nr:hypothetical protein FPV67DRAFT_1491611 [Lyophyllum atratum]